jgi:hypothetical protein
MPIETRQRWSRSDFVFRQVAIRNPKSTISDLQPGS